MAELKTTIVDGELTVKGEHNIYEDKYTELESKPNDWETNYKNYYKKENGIYIKISDETAPAFSTGFYKKTSEIKDGNDNIAARISDIKELRDTVQTDVVPKLNDLSNEVETKLDEKLDKISSSNNNETYTDGKEYVVISTPTAENETTKGYLLDNNNNLDDGDQNNYPINQIYNNSGEIPKRIKVNYKNGIYFDGISLIGTNKTVNIENNLAKGTVSRINDTTIKFTGSINRILSTCFGENISNNIIVDTKKNDCFFSPSFAEMRYEIKNTESLLQNNLQLLTDETNNKKLYFNTGIYFKEHYEQSSDSTAKTVKNASVTINSKGIMISTEYYPNNSASLIQLYENAIIVSGGYVEAQYFNATSDKRLKKNIIPYKSDKSILDLPLYEFDYTKDNSHTIGLLAQDVQKDFPDMVKEDNSEEKYLSIKESKLVYLLMDECKKLRDRVSQLEKEVECLKK